MANWKQTVVDRLDALEEQQHILIPVYSTLLYNEDTLKRCNSKLKQLKSDTVVSDLDNALEQIKQLQQQANLNCKLLQEKDSVNNELLVAYGAAKKDKESIRELYKKLETKHAKLQEEMSMSKRTINVINDHLLELEMENNMLNLSLAKTKN